MQNAAQRLHEALPWAFLLIGLIASLLFAWTLPPFQMADEQTHFYRSAIITSGPGALVVPGSRGGVVTGRVHQAILDAHAPFDRLRGHPEQRVRGADLAAVEGIRLDARRAQVMPGQALNPALYAPSSAAVAWGWRYGWEVLDVLYLARALSAIAAVAVGFLALRLAGHARLPMFAILLLPMATALYGSVGQDGLIITLFALGAAILSRGMAAGRPLRRWECAAVAACIALAAMAKIPLAVFAALVWLAPAEDRRFRLFAAVAAALVPVAWNGWIVQAGWAAPPPPGMTTDPAAQAQWILTHLDALPALAWQTFEARGVQYAEQFVGVLGSLDTRIWPRFYDAAFVMLGLAFAGAVSFGLSDGWRAVRFMTPVLVIISAAGIFASLYLGWSNVGSPTVEGVQGRYLIPLALMAPLALEGPRSLFSGDRMRTALGMAATAAVLVFPIVSLVVAQQSLIARYYLH